MDQDFKYSEDGKILYECLTKDIEEVVIPDEVEVIAEHAFYKCDKLTKVTLSSKLIEIGDFAFDMTDVKSVTLPKSLQKLGKNAFRYFTEDWRLVHTETKVAKGNGIFYTDKKALYRYDTMCQELKYLVHKKSNWSMLQLDPVVMSKIQVDYEKEDYKELFNHKENYTEPYYFNKMRKQELKDMMPLIEIGSIGTFSSDQGRNCIMEVRSANTDEVKFQVYMGLEDETLDTRIAWKNCWSQNAVFDFATADELFKKMKNMRNRTNYVLSRLQYPYELSEEKKEEFYTFLKRNGAKIASYYIEDDNIQGLMDAEQYGILTKTNINKVIDAAMEQQKIEIVAHLMEYKNSNF